MVLRRARRRIRRGISRVDFWLGVRLALVSVSAMVIGRLLGLEAYTWAGISAIVVSTGTPGGSFSASLARVGGTLIGLASGMLMVLLLGHSLWAAALAIPLSLVLAQGLGLKAAVKVAALSTLFPILGVFEVRSLHATWILSLSRAENVLVGCAVTLLVDGLLWPERIASRIQARLKADFARVGELAAAFLREYAQGGEMIPEGALARLQEGRASYAELLRELGAEPEDPDALRAELGLRVETLQLLVDHCAALRDILGQSAGDEAQALLRDELLALAGALGSAGSTLGSPAFTEAAELLRTAGQRLEAAYEVVRGDRGTQAFPRQEVFRLLGVIYHGMAMVRNFGGLGVPEGAEAAEG